MLPRMRYATPEEAEEAFYRAFERRDLEAMMGVWSAADHVVCIHPMGPRLTGVEAVRRSWAEIFASSERLRFRLDALHRVQGPALAVHVVRELIHVAGEAGPRPPVEATNVYQLERDGWRMILHHASPAPRPRRAAPQPARQLH